MGKAASAAQRVPSPDALRPFVELAERRLYKALVTEAERQLARVERDDVFVRQEALKSAAGLFLLARSFATPAEPSEVQ